MSFWSGVLVGFVLTFFLCLHLSVRENEIVAARGVLTIGKRVYRVTPMDIGEVRP